MSVKAFRFATESGETDPGAALLWGYGCRGMVEADGELIAYFDREIELPLAGCWEEVDETDYVAAYHASLGPLDLGRLVVAPSHRRVEVSVGQRVLWLDPGSAFGSGHHETTRMALEALIALDPFGLEVCDVGAGSGILAIAADLLGAARSVGLDSDPGTVPVARANARLNGSRAGFVVAAFDDGWPGGSADVLVANLYAELHVALMPHYRRVLRPAGRLLLTGILSDRAAAVEAALAGHFEPTGRRSAGEWTLLEARR